MDRDALVQMLMQGMQRRQPQLPPLSDDGGFGFEGQLPQPAPPPSLLDQMGSMGGQVNPLTKGMLPPLPRFEQEMLPQRRYGKGQLV